MYKSKSIDHDVKNVVKISTLLIVVLSVWLIDGNTCPAQEKVPSQPVNISPLLVGENAPDVKLVNLENKEIGLQSILSEKPTILIFYRGGWCPYCNTHLAELNEIEGQIIDMGYQIVAVSPNDPEHLKGSIDRHELKYHLYSDKSLIAAKEFGIAFQAPERLRDRLEKWSGGENSNLLPVPSVFVLNTDGEILFEYINPNYKLRISGDLLLAVLKALKE